MTELSSKVQMHLIEIQPQFKCELHNQIVFFAKDNSQFISSYTERGPMGEGINPREASERLQEFQCTFDGLWRRFQTYSDGEELFGLVKTPYPELERIRKELNLLQKLYSTYNTVMDSIDGYYDIAWVDMDIEKINSDLIDFQNR